MAGKKTQSMNEVADPTFETYRQACLEGRIEFVTFHPSYSYEEFIEGLTVDLGEGNNSSASLRYTIKDGLFKKLCARALIAAMPEKTKPERTGWKEAYEKYLKSEKTSKIQWDAAPKYVLIIDEINRGDISKILGELVTLLEADKRLAAGTELVVKLPLSQEDFSVPQNIYIIATMNTADRSIALLDVALRRRFGFIPMDPNLDLLLDDEKNRDNIQSMKNEGGGTWDLFKQSVDDLKKLNEEIAKDKSLGKDKKIGHSFLFNVTNKKDLDFAIKYEIVPLVDEYCYGNEEKKSSLLSNLNYFSKDLNPKKAKNGKN